jgi:hypothetical protein
MKYDCSISQYNWEVEYNGSRMEVKYNESVCRDKKGY